MRIGLTVCLPQEAQTVGLVRAAVSDLLRRVGADQGCIDDVCLAVSEACTNVLDHAAGEDEYEVSVQVEGLCCEIRVRNAGNGFDAAALSGVMPDASSPRGRGVAIMRAVMDNVHLASTSESGTIVHLVRDLTLRADSPFAGLAAKRRQGP